MPLQVPPQVTLAHPLATLDHLLLEIMEAKTNHRKAGRPSYTGVARSKQVSISMTPDERTYIIAGANSAGMMFSHFARDAMLDAAEKQLAAFQDVQGKHKNQFPKPAKLTKMDELVSSTGFQNVSNESKIAQEIPNTPVGPQTRAGARTKNKKESKELGVSSSLRSSQAKAPEPEAEVPEPDPTDSLDLDENQPWHEPAELKQTLKLSDGQVVTNKWLWANGCRITRPDVNRILNNKTMKVFRIAMLKCFARSLRDSYVRRWCSAYNRRTNAWLDTFRSNTSFMAAAKYLAIEFVERGMTTTQFIDACDEMRPKAVKFVPVDLMGGAIGSRVAAWIPEEQRERGKPIDSHVDNSGTQWITPSGESPVIVLRTAADRDKFLKSIKVR